MKTLTILTILTALQTPRQGALNAYAILDSRDPVLIRKGPWYRL